MRIRRISLLVLALALLAVTASPAGAHVEIYKSDPASGGTVGQGTREISITFISLDTSRPVDVAVLDASGTDQVSGTPRVRPPDKGTEVVVPVQPLQLGPHTVRWSAFSSDADGHFDGSYTFTVVESSAGGRAWVLWLALLVIALAVGATMVASRRQR